MKTKIAVMILSLAIGVFGTFGCEKKSKTETAIKDATKKADETAAKAVEEGTEVVEEVTK